MDLVGSGSKVVVTMEHTAKGMIYHNGNTTRSAVQSLMDMNYELPVTTRSTVQSWNTMERTKLWRKLMTVRS